MCGDSFAAPKKGQPGQNSPLVIKEQGGFSFAGKVEVNPNAVPGDPNTYSRHCDHGYANFSIPMNARKLPIIMWHSTHTKTWESNPSFMGGHQAFQDIFLRRDWGVYIIDPPRQGRANYPCVTPDFVSNWPNIGRDSSFISWRLGTWSPPAPQVYFPGSRMAPLDTNGELVNQILRARYADNEHMPDAFPVQSDAGAKLLDMVGPSILFTHSGSGYPGWLTAIKSPKVASIVSFEPGYVFPPGETRPGQREVPLADFMKLTKIPIVIILGDRLAPQTRPDGEAFVNAINSRGGNATLIALADLGILGNSHVMMLEENNVEVADIVSKFLKDNGLDKR
jgi:hypothetical protein